MNIVILLIVSQNYMPLPMILLGMYYTSQTKPKSNIYLDMLNDHMMFEKYSVFFSKKVNLYKNI